MPRNAKYLTERLARVGVFYVVYDDDEEVAWFVHLEDAQTFIDQCGHSAMCVASSSDPAAP